MIIFYEGIPGSGKTYDAVRKIVDNLRRYVYVAGPKGRSIRKEIDNINAHRHVYTNIDGMEFPECQEAIKSIADIGDYELATYFHILNQDDVRRFWDVVEPGSLIVLDEVHKYFNSRDWQSAENRKFADWASTHRHFGFDLVLITQRVEKVDSQVRTMVEWTYKYKKVNFVGSFIKNKYVLFSYCGDSDGDPLSKKVLTYDKRIFACYQSYATKDTKELGVQKTENIFKKPIFIFLLISVIFTGIMFSKSSLVTGDVFGTEKITKRNEDNLKKIKQQAQAPEPPISSMKVIDDKKVEVPKFPGSGVQPRPGISAPLTPLPPQPSQYEKPVEKKLFAVIDGKKIFKCGDKLCSEN